MKLDTAIPSFQAETLLSNDSYLLSALLENTTDNIYFKDVESLRKMLSINGKILSRKRTGASAAEQRMITEAIKRARFLGMLPYIGGSVV